MTSNKKVIKSKYEINNDDKKTNYSFEDTIRLPDKFASTVGAASRLIMRDLNNNNDSPTFFRYTKEQIQTYLKNPYTNEKPLRDAVIYIYGASSHFRRLIQYFVGLSDLSYVVSPYKIDTKKASTNKVYKNYRQVLDTLAGFDIKNQARKILTVVLREDVFYGTMWESSDSVIIQQLPSDYCSIAVIENNVLNVSFDFSYFDSHSEYLETYPDEFNQKYKIYQNDRGQKWQELDSPTSFAIKCNNDILTYAMPPFAGILREIYDLEDYRQLKLTKTQLENYAMLVMKLGINNDGEWTMDFDMAKDFWRNLDNVLPEEVGSVLSPMDINKISFEKSNTGDTNTIADAEERLFSAAGVSSLLFNNEKASSNALLLSIKADQSITFGIVKSLEGVLNRYIQSKSYGKNFKTTFLDCSPFNRKDLGDAYLKACQYGFPMVSYYCASQGMSQDEVDYMNFLEDDILGLKQRFVPVQSSNTQSGTAGDAGRPEEDLGDLGESGEITREQN